MLMILSSIQMALDFNSGTSFSLTHSLHKRTGPSFTFENPGKLINDAYLVINFNDFDYQADARLPLVSITAFNSKNDAEGSYYFSNRKADWTFDENIVTVPLVGAELFVVSISSRSVSSQTLDGVIGVSEGPR